MNGEYDLEGDYREETRCEEEREAGGREMRLRNPIRVAWFVSTRELARNEEMENASGVDVSAAHIGSLPYVIEYLMRYNTAIERNPKQLHPKIDIALIVMDDDRPERDFRCLNIPIRVAPSSFACIKIPKDTSQDVADVMSAQKDAAKIAYEQRLLAILAEQHIDLVLADRYMRIFGPTFLEEYLGLTLNTHPARLPGLEGKTPTADALGRAKATNYCWHGNTFHIVDAEVDHGPPIVQEEKTRIYPATDSLERLRYRNRQREHRIVCAGMVSYLRDPRVLNLIGLHREIPGVNGNRRHLMERRNNLRRDILSDYRTFFELNLAVERYAATRSEPGCYKYSMFLMKNRLRKLRRSVLPRQVSQVSIPLQTHAQSGQPCQPRVLTLI